MNEINEFKKELLELKHVYLDIREKELNINKYKKLNKFIDKIYLKQYSSNHLWVVFKTYYEWEVKDWVLKNKISPKVMISRNEVAFPLEYFIME